MIADGPVGNHTLTLDGFLRAEVAVGEDDLDGGAESRLGGSSVRLRQWVRS